MPLLRHLCRFGCNELLTFLCQTLRPWSMFVKIQQHLWKVKFFLVEIPDVMVFIGRREGSQCHPHPPPELNKESPGFLMRHYFLRILATPTTRRKAWQKTPAKNTHKKWFQTGLKHVKEKVTFQWTHISHLWNRKNIFNCVLVRDILVPKRVTTTFVLISCGFTSPKRSELFAVQGLNSRH